MADNAPNVDVTLKNLAEISKTVQPVVAQLQSMTENADRVLKAVDPDKVRTIVDNVESLSAKSTSVVDRADKLLADNSGTINATLQHADVFAKALADNAPNIDATLKNLAELSKTVQPVVAQLQSLYARRRSRGQGGRPGPDQRACQQRADFSQALAESSDNVKVLAREGAVLAGHLNDTAGRLDTALIDANSVLKAVNSQKIASIVNSANDVVQTVRQNRDNIDSTLKNFSDMSAKLNKSADKVDGVLTSAQSFLGSPGTKGAVDRIGEAAQIDRNSPTTSIRGSRISPAASANSRIRACASMRRSPSRGGASSRTLTAWCARSETIQVRSSSGQDPHCLSITAGNDGA